MKRFRKQIKALLGGLTAFLLLLSGSALAANNIDPGRDVKLTIIYQDGELALSDAEFDIYRVAAVDESGRLSPVAPYSRFNVDIQGENDAAWKALASTLEGYVLRDEVMPTASGKTDRQGSLTFSNQSPGLYLVLGRRHTQEGKIYDAAPFMVLLPARDVENDQLLYDVIVSPKFESRLSSENGVIARKVLKVWADQGHEKERPQEIVIQLLRDGEIYDAVTLNAGNSWRYTWSELDDRYVWTVVEKELEDYTVTVTREGTTFVVTNTYDRFEPVKPTPTPKPANPGTPGHNKLPQTGQLWWPVPVLLAGGLLFIVLGLLRRRRMENEK